MTITGSGAEEGDLGQSPPAVTCWGVQPPSSVDCLELRAYMNDYSILKAYFR